MTVNIPENNIDNTTNQEKVVVQPEQQNQKKEEITQPPLQENKQADGTQEDPNWKAFREARKKDRAEREAAEKRAAEKEAEAAALKAAMEAAFAKAGPIPQQQYYPQQENYHSEETEEQKIDKIVEAKIAAREAAAERARLEKEHREYPQRLTQTFSDFNQAIAQENLDYLDYHYPEVSRPLQELPDGFNKWAHIYHAVKKFVPNTATAKKDAARAEANMNKPKSISSTGIMQPGEAVNRSSYQEIEAKRAARYMEMQKIIKSI